MLFVNNFGTVHYLDSLLLYEKLSCYIRWQRAKRVFYPFEIFSAHA